MCKMRVCNAGVRASMPGKDCLPTARRADAPFVCAHSRSPHLTARSASFEMSTAKATLRGVNAIQVAESSIEIDRWKWGRNDISYPTSRFFLEFLKDRIFCLPARALDLF